VELVDRSRDASPEVLEGVVSHLAAVIDGQPEKADHETFGGRLYWPGRKPAYRWKRLAKTLLT
jgi:hypothetical protein